MKHVSPQRIFFSQASLSVILALAILLAFAVCPAPASAQTIYKTINPEKLEAIMDKMDLKVSAEDNSVSWDINGKSVTIFIGPDEESIQFYCYWFDAVTRSKINDWNRTTRFSRAYLDDDGDPVLELDLDLVGGVTEARIQDFIKTCYVSFKEFENRNIE